MSTHSDLTIDPSTVLAENVSEATNKVNTYLEGVTSRGPRCIDVGAPAYREMIFEGKTAVPAPVILPNAFDATLPSRDSYRSIPIRIYKPDNGQASKGVFLHFHGGGFVIGSEKSSDKVLQLFANEAQLTTISVGYRHAPEDPHPAAVHDCIDAAEYLVDHPSAYGPVRFTGGESAGACLALLTAVNLLRSRPSHALSGLVLRYGWYDLSLGLPTTTLFTRPLGINRSVLSYFADSYLPGWTTEERRDPSASPLYTDLPALAAASRKGLPPALFIVGTADCLFDDTILMGAKWSIAGGESIVKFYPGASHLFTNIPGLAVGEEANAVSVQFVKERI